MTTAREQEESSGANNDSQKDDEPARKRKATEEADNMEVDKEKAQRRKRNRDAAKKCRERKVQETENLRKKNEELQSENCTLVKQRNELRQRCNTLEETLRQHKEQGCILQDLDPPLVDLDHILDPATPPSPSFAGSPMSSPSPYSSSPAASPAPPGRGSLRTYNADPLPVNPSYGGTTNSHCSQSKSVTYQKASGQVNVKQMMTSSAGLEATSEATPRVSATVPSQQSTAPILDPPVYTLRVRDEHGHPKDLCLSREDYTKIVRQMQASEMVFPRPHHQQSKVSTVDYTYASDSPQMSSFPQVNPTGLSELMSGHGQSENPQCQAEMSPQDCNLKDLLNIDDDWMPFSDSLDNKKRNELCLVNPNDVFMGNALAEMEFDPENFPLSEGDSVVVQHEAKNVKCTTDGDAGMLSSQQMFAGQTRTDRNALTDRSRHYFQTGKISRLAEEHCSSNDKIFTVTVTDPNTANILEQTSAQCDLSPLIDNAQSYKMEGTVKEPVLSTQTGGQTIPCTSTLTDLACVPLTNNTAVTSCQDLPVLLRTNENVLGKSVFTLPATETNQLTASEYLHPSPDPVSAMKAVRIRPKATSLSASTLSTTLPSKSLSQTISPQNPVQSVQSSGNGMTLIPGSCFGLSTGSQIVGLSGASAGFEQSTLVKQPTKHRTNTDSAFLQLIVEPQNGSPTPVVRPMPSFSNSKSAQGFPILGKASAQVDAAPAQGTLLMSNSTHWTLPERFAASLLTDSRFADSRP